MHHPVYSTCANNLSGCVNIVSRRQRDRILKKGDRVAVLGQSKKSAERRRGTAVR